SSCRCSRRFASRSRSFQIAYRRPSSSRPAWCAPSIPNSASNGASSSLQRSSRCCNRLTTSAELGFLVGVVLVARCALIRGGAPHGVAHVIGDQQRTARIQRHAHRAAPGLTLVADESRQHILRHSLRLAFGEGHEHHLVSRRGLAIPRPVLADEHAVVEPLRKRGLAGVHQAQCRDVRAQGVVGRQRLRHQVRALRLDALVDVLAVVAVRPAVERALLHRGQVVRHEIVTELVSLVGHGPQVTVDRLPGHAIRVAQAGGEQLLLAGGEVNFPDRGAALFHLHAIFRGVGIGADGGVELAAVLARDDVLGPVMVARAAGKVLSRVPCALIFVAPGVYGNFMMESVFATYSVLPTSAMPNGELRPVMNSLLTSATPSPLASRSSVMRFAEGTTDPALVMNLVMTLPLMPLPSSGRSGAADSATSTSPLGNVYTQRGCDR